MNLKRFSSVQGKVKFDLILQISFQTLIVTVDTVLQTCKRFHLHNRFKNLFKNYTLSFCVLNTDCNQSIKTIDYKKTLQSFFLSH